MWLLGWFLKIKRNVIIENNNTKLNYPASYFPILLSFDCHSTKNEPRNAVNSAFLGSCTLLEFGKSKDVLKYISLSFVSFLPLFYFCCIYYFGSLIFCCQFVANRLSYICHILLHCFILMYVNFIWTFFTFFKRQIFSCNIIFR